MKKIVAAVLAAVMVSTVSVTAFAAKSPNYSNSDNDSTGGGGGGSSSGTVYTSGSSTGAYNAAVAGMTSFNAPGTSDKWYVDGNGNWKYVYSNGTLATGWQLLTWTANGVTQQRWYLFDQNGWMLDGLQDVNGNTYYLNPVSDGFKGAMITGTAQVNGQTMNFANSGELLN
ncbi:MAG: hypothetical protein K6C06_07790 [Lachnospiraceae bacterium]|nr:hypothetical protein [Lachnospiraceae bacterium]